MENLLTLTAERVKETQGPYKGLSKTVLYSPDGTVKATIPASQTQPRKGSKTITLNCWKWSLVWR